LFRFSVGITSVCFGEIDNRPVVVLGSKDKTIRVWDAQTGKQIGKVLRGHTSIITSVAFGAIDGKPVVVSGSRDGTVRLWDAQTGSSRSRRETFLFTSV
jgi:WD40 repeat protein